MIRSTRFFAVASPFVLLVAAAAAACVSSNAGPGPEDAGGVSELDSGQGAQCVPGTNLCVTPLDGGPRPDGTVPSQDGGGPTHDGATPAEDGASPGEDGGPTGAITVVVTGPAGPEQGITVVFDDASGAVVGMTTTDATGTAQGTIPANAQVTILLGTVSSPSGFVNLTIAGAQPGDTLAVTDTTQPAPDAGIDYVQITSFPPGFITNSTSWIYWAGSCGEGTGNFGGAVEVIGLTAACQHDGKFPILAIDYESEYEVLPYTDQELGYTYLKSLQVLTDGGTAYVAMGADGGTPDAGVDSGDWFTPGSEAITVTSVPPEEQVVVNYSEVASGVMRTTNAISGIQTGEEDAGYDAGTLYFYTHPGYPDFVQTQVRALSRVASTGYQIGVVRSDAPAPTVSFDFSQMLPPMTTPALALTTPGRPTVSWGTTSPLPATAAGTVVTLGFADQSFSSGTWVFVVPASTTSVQAPLLPASTGRGAASDAGALYFSATGVIVLGGSALPSYAQMRSTYPPVSTQLLTNPGGTIAPPLPADGTLLVDAIQ